MFSFNNFLYCLHISACHCSQLDVATTIVLLVVLQFTVSRNLHTKIITFACDVSSHKTDWTLSDPVECSVLPFISQGKQSDECSWRIMTLPSRNMYKCRLRYCCLCILFTFAIAVLLLPICLLVYPFFILMLLYFCLFADHVNKSIVFCFYVKR